MAFVRDMVSRLPRDRVWRRWTLAWVGGSVLGVVNGVARETLYRDRVGETAADQISAGALVGLLALYFAGLQRQWPIPTKRKGVGIGATWVVLTVLFEFGFGHYVDRKSWSELFENYDVLEGRLWVAVLAWIAVGPAATRAVAPRT